jgi:hypothetical protein
MKEQNHDHLREEQILWAVIDKKELTGDARQHLLDCGVCKTRVEQFSHDLLVFGDRARHAVPPYSRPVKLPAEKPVRAVFNGGWFPFFGTLAAAGLVLFFYFMGMNTLTPVQIAVPAGQESLLEDEVLMRDISEMVEDPLSEDIYQFTGENGNGYYEDFLDFVVPGMQDDDSQSEFII